MRISRYASLILLLWSLAITAMAANPDGIAAAVGPTQIEALAKNTGVVHTAPKGRTPEFLADPSWPLPLPHHWIIGQVGGLFVDRHDHIWVYHRPRSLTDDEAGLEDALPGVTDMHGVPANGMGFARPHGPIADCCKAAPAVLMFDRQGKLLKAWGGPTDPGYLEGKCRAEQGCIWPNQEHGIYVDDDENVWLAGSGAKPPGEMAAWTSNRGGGDGMVQKFDRDGNFKLRIGGTPLQPDSNDRQGGVNGTPNLFRPADMVVDTANHRLFIADGYGNRRVLIVDANDGRYLGHFGAYGNNPVDDSAAEAAGRWQAGNGARPAFFRNPVHCVTLARDGKLYVCDRGNNRIQLFDSKDPNLGSICANPAGEAGKCGYLGEKFIAETTETPPVIPGTVSAVKLSTDPAQSCLYVADNSNQTIYILDRASLQELGRLGRSGRNIGQFHWLHQLALDSAGTLYTGEVETAKRVQKFAHYGPSGCSGPGLDRVGGVLQE